MKLLLLFILASSCAHQDYRVRRPFLYHIKKHDQQAFLFGTIHVGVKAKDLPPGVLRTFERSDAFAAEVDMIKDARVIAARMNERMLRSFDEPELREVLPEATLERLSQALAADFPGRAAELLSRVSVVGALAYLQERRAHEIVFHSEQELFGQLARLDGSLDQDLTEQAMVQGKPIHTLDDLLSREFISCMLSLKFGVASTYPQKIAGLLSGEQRKVSLDPLLSMLKAYRNGNERFLQQLSVDQSCALVERNEAWIQKIKKLMQHYRRPFITMGVLHLEHEGSVLELLEDEGFVVTRVTESE